MNLKIKKKDSWAMTPTYGTDDSAGADLYAGEDGVVLIAPGETKLISTGIGIVTSHERNGNDVRQSGR